MKKQLWLGSLLLSFAVAGALSTNGFVPSATAQLTGLMSQGVTIAMNVTSGGKTTTSTQYFSANATSTVSADGSDSIVRFDQQKLISIDNKKKTYSEMTFQQMQEMMDQMGKGMEEISNNPQAAAALKQMMGGGNSAPLTVTKQGAGETIAGYATEKFLVTGPLNVEIWAAPDLKMPTTYYDAMKIRMPANPMFDMSKLFDAFKQINGYPMKYVSTMSMFGRTMTTTYEVTAVQKGAVPPSTFEVPAGYKQVQEKAPGKF